MDKDRNPEDVLILGLATMFVLIGIAAVLEVFFRTPIQFPSYFGWIGSLIGLFIGLFFLALFIWYISNIFRFAGHDRGYRFWNWWDHDEAKEILRERYAKGEITKE